MAAAAQRARNQRLPPEVNRYFGLGLGPKGAQQSISRVLTRLSSCRALFVRNLPFNISSDEMYDIFGKYGPIRQIRM